MEKDIQQSSLGRQMQRERESHHWTQKQLAEKIGGSVPSINRWEHDRSLPRPDMFDLLIKAFGKAPEHWGIGKQIRWNLPFFRNPYFTGREQTLTHLHQALAPKEGEVLSRICALSGLGGIGKTQTALEYAYRFARTYDTILWVQADSRDILCADFAALAQTLDLQEREESNQFRMISAVKRWLEKQDSWLLIFDNVEDLVILSDFLPCNPTGAVLVTTRCQFTGQVKHISMSSMHRQEGISFLSKCLASTEDIREDGLRIVPESDQRTAEKLWEVMGGLPLALDQARAYIESRQCSLKEYLDLYRHHRKYLLQERGGPLTGHPDAVATTWSLTLELVEQRHPGAAALLRLCAFLSPDAIPEEVFVKGTSHFAAPLSELTVSSLRLHDAISVLLNYSLVRRNPKNKTLSVHRLVQQVLQDMLQEEERHFWVEQAMLAINTTFPSAEQHPWIQSERLLPHALLIARSIEQYHLTSVEAEQVLQKTASYLQGRACYPEAESLFKQMLILVEQRLGFEHAHVGMSLNSLAHLYKEQGRYAEAEPLYQHAVRIFEHQPDFELQDIADSWSSLAVIFWQKEKFMEAELLSRWALHSFEKQLGSEHPEVARPLNTLAVLSWRKGQYNQAKSYLQRALHIRERQLGPDHPLVARVLNNLAALSWEEGQYAEVEPLYQRVLHIWEQKLGPDHPLVATALNNLAQIWGEQGKYAEAEQLYWRALHIWERMSASEHSDVAYSFDGLAVLYREQRKYKEAEVLFQHALHIWKQQLSPEHTQVALSLNHLAVLYREQGKYKEAERCFQHALQIQEQVEGPRQSDIAESMEGFAKLRDAQGNYGEARDWYTRAFVVREQSSGIQHPKTIKTLQCLITLLQTMEQYEEAAQLEARFL